MATCIKCNTALKASFKFCDECGTPVGPKKCVNCNRELEQTRKFCPYCGKPIKKPVNTAKKSPADKKAEARNFFVSAWQHRQKRNYKEGKPAGLHDLLCIR